MLAPAGSESALHAAVAAGADAVYLGLDAFNARRGAQNFTPETLADACRFAHLHDVRVYLTANVLILPSEMHAVLQMVAQAWASGVDAVIVQDLGLLRLIRSHLPDVRLHASTQLNAHSSDTIRALQWLGVSRVTLARETSLDEIAHLSELGRSLGVEVETFAHGALCICYSGQCLLSSLIGGRSANRGACAQPCRLPYELIDDAGDSLSDTGAYLLSPKDLAGITLLPAMIGAGTAALKLEGRAKSAEYVALVTGVYRAALDRALAEGDAYSVRDGETSVLSEAFSRGFTEAYLLGETGNGMMSYRRPNNRGVLVGRIVDIDGVDARIALETALDAEDTIEVWTSSGRFAQKAGPLDGGPGFRSTAPAGAKVAVVLEQSAGLGDRVFRVRNAALTAVAERLAASAGPPIGLRFRVRVLEGVPLFVEVLDASGRSGSAQGAVVEEARTRAVTAADVMDHVGRLGGTPYTADSYDIELSPNVGVGFSELHALRRAALEDYEKRLLDPWTARVEVRVTPPEIPVTDIARGRALIIAAATDLETAEACLDAGASRVHLPTWALEPGVPIADEIVPCVPRICHDWEVDQAYRPALEAGRAVAGTIGALRELASRGVEVEAHWSLNALNAHTVSTLSALGASAAWVSPELTAAQLTEIARHAVVPVGVAVAGRQELMVTEHCLLMPEGDCARRCRVCRRRAGVRMLRDRKGYAFPVATDPTGRSHLYNAVPLNAVRALPELLEAGVRMLRVDVEVETPRRAAALVEEAVRSLHAAESRRVLPEQPPGTTSGHFFRGVGA